mgnify:CR=1 FL=1
MLPDRAGLEVMREILASAPQTCVIVITANGSINKAVEMMRAGAHEFLVKPFDDQRLLAAIENARKALHHRPPAAHIDPNVQVLPPFIGHSPNMLAVYDKIRSVARSMATVFITGESGTGKELTARAIHAQSQRSDKPLVSVNCTTLTDSLLESELLIDSNPLQSFNIALKAQELSYSLKYYERIESDFGDSREAADVEKLLEKLEEDDDVQNVYHSMEM